MDDFRLAVAGIRVLGGDVAVVDDDGNFGISLSAAGSHHILVLSRFKSRDIEDPIDAALRSVLEMFFERFQTLLGSVRYHFSPINPKSEKNTIKRSS